MSLNINYIAKIIALSSNWLPKILKTQIIKNKKIFIWSSEWTLLGHKCGVEIELNMNEGDRLVSQLIGCTAGVRGQWLKYYSQYIIETF